MNRSKLVTILLIVTALVCGLAGYVEGRARPLEHAEMPWIVKLFLS